MKRYAPLLLTFLFLPLLFSCFDLEEDLYDQLEKEDYYTDYESLMASVLRPYEHAKWAETNFSFWLQELSADQLVITQKREHWEDGGVWRMIPVPYTHFRAPGTPEPLVCRFLLEKKKNR